MVKKKVRGALPYKLTAGAVPCREGWLLVSARLRGATFAPDFPRVIDNLSDIIHRRPAFSIVLLNAPIGAAASAVTSIRSCDQAALNFIEDPVIFLRSTEAEDSAEVFPQPGHLTDYLEARYREVEEEMAPYLQRAIVEALPELSFYQLNGEVRLLHSPFSPEGYVERRQLLVRIPGVTRILDTVIPGVSKFQLLGASALLWSARRITSRAGKRVPADPEWDDNGLRIEILR